MENATINGNSWIACFDLLGFRNRVQAFEKSYGCGHLDTFAKNFYGDLVKAQKWQQEFQPDKILIA